jgi:hypothetical protein
MIRLWHCRSPVPSDENNSLVRASSSPALSADDKYCIEIESGGFNDGLGVGVENRMLLKKNTCHNHRMLGLLLLAGLRSAGERRDRQGQRQHAGCAIVQPTVWDHQAAVRDLQERGTRNISTAAGGCKSDKSLTRRRQISFPESFPR